VVLRRALSNQNTPFETLIRLGEDLPDKNRPALPQICKAKQEYRMNRRLSRPEQAQLVEEYQSGKSTFELAHRLGTNRHTVAKHLRRRGIVVRGGQVKMTPDVIEHARRLYADGRSLVASGKQLGVDASTVHKALRRAGVSMRDTHGRPT
jgi:DNA invertase Pin-like site-specific DNA recombinase